MIDGMLSGSVADYQMTAWAMAIVWRGMNADEIAALTQSMLASGSNLQRCSDRPRVDKHSTGGLGDKVSLVLAPLLACCDLDVPMLSGRGLGITGGTLDKLESYEGYRCDLGEREIQHQLRQLGCVITGTTPDIAPADKTLYGLRDVSGTVPSPALITSSILCKKLAERLDALVLDVKYGSASFMKTKQQAETLANSLEQTALRLGLPTKAILSDMNQPLGRMVGNACEANEAVCTLRGEGPDDLRELTLRLSSELLVKTGVASDLLSATQRLEAILDSGLALQKYQQMIEAQGGKYCESLPLVKAYDVPAARSGWIAAIDGEELGRGIIQLGGGRKAVGDQLNHQVGVEMLVRIGDQVEASQPLARIFADQADATSPVHRVIADAIQLADSPVDPLPLFG